MTEEEFRKYVEGFFNWTSKTERPVESWLLSLGEWADSNYNSEYEKRKRESEA